MHSSKRLTSNFFLRDGFEPKPIPARINPGIGSQREANRPHSGPRGESDATPGGLMATMFKVVETGTAPTIRDDGENEHSASAGETEQVNMTTLLRAPFCGFNVMVSGTLPPEGTPSVVERFSTKSAGGPKVAVANCGNGGEVKFMLIAQVLGSVP